MRKLIFAAAALASVVVMSSAAYAGGTWQCKYVSINGKSVYMCGY